MEKRTGWMTVEVKTPTRETSDCDATAFQCSEVHGDAYLFFEVEGGRVCVGLTEEGWKALERIMQDRAFASECSDREATGEIEGPSNPRCEHCGEPVVLHDVGDMWTWVHARSHRNRCASGNDNASVGGVTATDGSGVFIA